MIKLKARLIPMKYITTFDINLKQITQSQVC